MPPVGAMATCCRQKPRQVHVSLTVYSGAHAQASSPPSSPPIASTRAPLRDRAAPPPDAPPALAEAAQLPLAEPAAQGGFPLLPADELDVLGRALSHVTIDNGYPAMGLPVFSRDGKRHLLQQQHDAGDVLSHMHVAHYPSSPGNMQPPLLAGSGDTALSVSALQKRQRAACQCPFRRPSPGRPLR